MLEKYRSIFYFDKSINCHLLELRSVRMGDLFELFKKGDKLILTNHAASRDNFPLANIKLGTVFEYESVHNSDDAIGWPCVCIKGVKNEHTSHGGFAAYRFALVINPRIKKTGGNV